MSLDDAAGLELMRGVIHEIDGDRAGWIVLRVVRLGESSPRYVLSIQEDSMGLRISARRQGEGDSLIGGTPCAVELT